jgi:hypothetical protein
VTKIRTSCAGSGARAGSLSGRIVLTQICRRDRVGRVPSSMAGVPNRPGQGGLRSYRATRAAIGARSACIGPPVGVKTAWETVTPAKVTAPMWANAFPCSVAPVAREIDL